ncbi:hypothetical protein [Intestinirhabdus alba]|jgi:hypothetical protein|uniref:Ead/Ea22-like family protein n=1 Tax=Intestinirhabdus alba TaxID=2899544 RepID=A0A6L6IHE6_9ENTR|nr:hypothetical protein [Intestinirhabdus alba]MTH45374.1 hypothetical protein [Intestinirhabdus alba]
MNDITALEQEIHELKLLCADARQRKLYKLIISASVTEALIKALETLAAENTALKVAAKAAFDEMSDHHDHDDDRLFTYDADGVAMDALIRLYDAEFTVEQLLLNMKTPATDVFLDEARAQGVEMLREHPAIKICSLTHVCDEFAAQLRKGVQS